MGSLTERNPSLWVATTRDAPRFERLTRDERADAVVVGAGITGLTTALLLRREGLDVVLVEAGAICGGATGYTTAKVSALHGLAYAELRRRHGDARTRAYAEANQAGLDEVARLVRGLSIDCSFERRDAYTYTEDPRRRAALEEEVYAAAAAGLPTELAETTDLPFPVVAAVRLPDQAQFHPRRYCAGLASAFVDAGGRLFERTRAVDVDTTRGGCAVQTDGAALSAPYVVLATHLPFVHDGAFFARAAPYRSYALGVRVGGEAPRGMYLSADSPVRSVRDTEEGVLIVSGEGHKVGQDDDTRRRYAALEEWARDRFAVATVPYRWSAQDFSTLDGLPYVGPVTGGNERVLVATGFAKWGMTNGTGAALMLRDRIIGRPNPWADAFDSTRTNPRRSIGTFLSENVDVARRFIGDRLGRLRPKAAHAPTCTHLGCVLGFNTAEETWDCPCHGSRFDREGRIIEGPAVRDIDRPPRPPAARGSG